MGNQHCNGRWNRLGLAASFVQNQRLKYKLVDKYVRFLTTQDLHIKPGKDSSLITVLWLLILKCANAVEVTSSWLACRPLLEQRQGSVLPGSAASIYGTIITFPISSFSFHYVAGKTTTRETTNRTLVMSAWLVWPSTFFLHCQKYLSIRCLNYVRL